MNNPNDRRIKKTTIAIREAFIGLLEVQHVNEVKVSEICKIADINRSTFYDHYYDVYDLLYSIQDQLISKALDMAQELKDECMEDRDEILHVLDFIYCEKEEICLLMKNDTNGRFAELIKKTINECFVHRIHKLYHIPEEIDEEELRRIIEFFSYGFEAVFYQWISEDFKTPKEEIADFTLKATATCFESILRRRQDD